MNIKKMNKGLDFLRAKYGAAKGEITLKDGHCYVGTTPLLPGRMERKIVELKKMTENGTLEGVSTLRFAAFAPKGTDPQAMLAKELDLAAYLGASDAHLAAGAAVLGNTSAPIGGDNTNCVIAGHRGWRGADYFRHIDRLQVGDTVTLTNLWETLTYTVADIQIIQPHEVDKIKIQQGRDLLTLLTCHPYASGGRQRFVVYCAN